MLIKRGRIGLLLIVVIATIGLFIGCFKDEEKSDSIEVNNKVVEKYEEDTKLIIQPLKDEFKILRPSNKSIKTGEIEITFTGMSDPNKELLLNGEKVPVYFTGNFTIVKKLNVGENKFEFTLGDKKTTYKIEREFKIVNSVVPKEKLYFEEGMDFTIKASLYSGAEAYALINGEKINLTQGESKEYIDARDTTYANFYGDFKAPSVDSTKSLGKVKIIATYDGKTEEEVGGEVIVAKKKENYPIGEIKNDSAKVYNDINSLPIPMQEYSYLPKGTLDYIKSDFVLDDKEYYILKSGRRVKKEDISIKQNINIKDSEITKVSVEDEGKYTTIKIEGANKIPFNISQENVNYKESKKANYEVEEYNPRSILISFDYINGIKSGNIINEKENLMFGDISVKDNKLSFKIKDGEYYNGHYSYYDKEGVLNIKFLRKLKSLEGAVILLDPGHGFSGGKIKDSGALGFNDINETDVNVSIAKKIEEELIKRGATPIRLKTESDTYKLKERGSKARENNADLFISIHNNSGGSGEINATETYYNTPFSMQLAKSINSSMVSLYKNRLFKGWNENFDRGSKYDYYTVTLERENPSVLVEVGYMDNPKSFNKLIDEEMQVEIAKSIVDGIENYINGK